jgi:hypothetical protein
LILSNNRLFNKQDNMATKINQSEIKEVSMGEAVLRFFFMRLPYAIAKSAEDGHEIGDKSTLVDLSKHFGPDQNTSAPSEYCKEVKGVALKKFLGLFIGNYVIQASEGQGDLYDYVEYFYNMIVEHGNSYYVYNGKNIAEFEEQIQSCSLLLKEEDFWIKTEDDFEPSMGDKADEIFQKIFEVLTCILMNHYGKSGMANRSFPTLQQFSNLIRCTLVYYPHKETMLNVLAACFTLSRSTKKSSSKKSTPSKKPAKKQEKAPKKKQPLPLPDEEDDDDDVVNEIEDEEEIDYDNL